MLAAFALALFPMLYLSYTRNLLARAGLVAPHTHPSIINNEDIGLFFPYDPIPRRDFAALAKYPPHNVNEPSKRAFATFYCTRSPDMRGPYFEATQQVIWRLLWSDYRSKYPVIIFVCPFIPKANRDVFAGQGAIVKEIGLLDDIIPDDQVSTKRWIDVLSKLNVWAEVEWDRIVFLDSDAFPVTNIDDLFDEVPVQRCKEEMLSPEDKAVVNNGKGGDEMCNYVYGGVQQFTADNINAGMLVIKPNLDLHAKILRAARSRQGYELQDMEQGILKSMNAFSFEGPFPVFRMKQIWNALPEYYLEYRDKGLEKEHGKIRVLHSKLWNRAWGGYINATELNDRWDVDWMTMCRFFDDVGSGFEEARKTGILKTPWDRYLEKQEEERKKNQG
jgi:hypothetical protein